MRVQAAVAGDQAGGGLLADAGHAGQPVARVAAQRGEVGVARRRHAVLGPDRGVVADLQLGHAAPAVEHRPRGRRRRAGTGPGRRRRPRPGPGSRVASVPMHVVGLVAGHADRGDAERVEDVQDHRHLGRQRVGHLLDPRPAARRAGASCTTAISSTRQAGRQSSSRAQTSRPGRRVRISVAIMSRKPRTALTGVPSVRGRPTRGCRSRPGSTGSARVDEQQGSVSPVRALAAATRT